MRKIQTNQIENEINTFVDVLASRGVDVEQVILFGSFAKGTAHDYSDIDLAVVSSQFGKDEMKEMMNLARWSLVASNRIEAVPITTRMLQSKYHPLIGEIKKWGRVVYEKSQA